MAVMLEDNNKFIFPSNTTTFYYLTSVKTLVVITKGLTEFEHWCKLRGIEFKVRYVYRVPHFMYGWPDDGLMTETCSQ